MLEEEMQEYHSNCGDLVQLYIVILYDLIDCTILPNHGELIWSSCYYSCAIMDKISLVCTTILQCYCNHYRQRSTMFQLTLLDWFVPFHHYVWQ